MKNNKIVIGKYIPYNTFIHRIDARIKFIALIFLIVAVFFNGGFESYILISIFLFIVVIWSKIPLRMLISPILSLILAFIFILVVSIFFSQPPKNTPNLMYYDNWFNIGSVQVYNQAFLRSIYIIWRIYLMIIATTIFTVTTPPLAITIAIEDLLKPLKLIKFPVHEIAMIIAIALRFIPTILFEAQKIIRAQASRGVDLNNGKFREKVKSLASLVVPLFVSAFQKAEDLANAMDARGYNPRNKRTRYRKLKIKFTDVIVFLLISCLLTISILYSLKGLSLNTFHWWFLGNIRPVFN